MFEGAYINSGAMSVASAMLDNIANNLANANTTGFKKTLINQKAYSKIEGYQNSSTPMYGKDAKQFIAETLGSVPHIATTIIDKSEGAMTYTSNKLDLALKEGFFLVKTPNGIKLTRNGHFFINSDNILVNENGFPVIGENYFRSGDFIHIKGKNFLIRSDGTVLSNGNKTDTISVRNGSNLVPAGKGLYSGKFGKQLTGNVISVGYLEQSNVNPVTEMADMIQVNRAFNRYEKIIDIYLNDIAQTDNRIARFA